MSDYIKERLKKNLFVRKNSVYIKVYVKPKARWTGLCLDNEDLIFYTEAHPKHHRANESILKYFTKLFKTKARFSSGIYSCLKIIEIKDLSFDIITKRLTEVVKTSC